MSAFFDTNVVFYRFDTRDPAKQRIARMLWQQVAEARAAAISSQVLAEFTHAVRRKLRPAMTSDQLKIAVDSLAPMIRVESNKGLVITALDLAIRHQLSIYDAMIVQAATDSGASILYSEDLHDGQRFGPVQVVNPFTQSDLAVNEPRSAYRAARATRRPRTRPTPDRASLKKASAPTRR